MTKGDVSTPCGRGNVQGFKKAFAILGLVLISGLLGARANLYYDYDYINTVLSSANSLPVRVPDGGLTLAMLGLALLALAWARNRLKRPPND